MNLEITENQNAIDLAPKYAMISQPINGVSDEEIFETREKARKMAEKLGYKLMNTYFDYDEEDLPSSIYSVPLYYLSQSLAKMSMCKLVIFCRGWEKHRGCRIEYEAAKAYDLTMLVAREDSPLYTLEGNWFPEDFVGESAKS